MEKGLKKQLEEQLIERFERYDELFTEGGKDPFHEDGTNLNLIRNHIIYFKNQIEKNLNGEEYPDIYYRDTPEEVDYRYMVKADEIRIKANEVLEVINTYPHMNELKDAMYYLDEQQIQSIGINRALSLCIWLEKGIKEDDLVEMRRLTRNWNIEDELNKAYEKLQSIEMKEGSQLSLFEMNM